MICASFMFQSLNAKRQGERNYLGEADYEDIRIKGRIQFERQRIIDGKGEEKVSEILLFTRDFLKPGDLVEHHGIFWPVKAVAEKKDLHNRFSHFEVRL